MEGPTVRQVVLNWGGLRPVRIHLVNPGWHLWLLCVGDCLRRGVAIICNKKLSCDPERNSEKTSGAVLLANDQLAP